MEEEDEEEREEEERGKEEKVKMNGEVTEGSGSPEETGSEIEGGLKRNGGASPDDETGRSSGKRFHGFINHHLPLSTNTTSSLFPFASLSSRLLGVLSHSGQKNQILEKSFRRHLLPPGP